MQATGQKPKAKPTTGTPTGVYKPEAIKDIAESLNISIPDTVASSLASDVEYRLNQIISEASRFMRHGRRTVLTTSDIDNALRVLNIEPLYGHLPYNPATFRRALPFPQLTTAGTVYFVEDEEIDFDRVLREEKITLPKGVSWTAHWLAVEGVQPLIPENPPAIPRDVVEAGDNKGDAINGPGSIAALAAAAASGKPNGVPNGIGVGAAGSLPFASTGNLPPGAKRPNAPAVGGPSSQANSSSSQPLVKQVLSRELQLYYARLTSSLLPPQPDFARRTAALGSLKSDAGLQALLPYLVRWVGEGVVGALKEGAQTENVGKVLDVLLDVIGAILDNQTLFVEPYVRAMNSLCFPQYLTLHSCTAAPILPPILSILLHSALPTSHATQLRTTASQTLSKLLTQHSTTYPSLSPRIMKTLLLALISPGKSQGTREGAIRGLVGVGKEAVRKGLVEGGGAKVVGAEWEAGARDAAGVALVTSVMDALRVLQPSNDMSDSLNPNDESDAHVRSRLQEVLGNFFAGQVAEDAAWAREILGLSAS